MGASCTVLVISMSFMLAPSSLVLVLCFVCFLFKMLFRCRIVDNGKPNCALTAFSAFKHDMHHCFLLYHNFTYKKRPLISCQQPIRNLTFVYLFASSGLRLPCFLERSFWSTIIPTSITKPTKSDFQPGIIIHKPPPVRSRLSYQ